MKKFGGTALIAVGFIALVIGLLLGTVFKSSLSASGSTTANGKGVVITQPGALEMGGTHVRISVTAPSSEKIIVATGYGDDVTNYAKGLRTQVITGKKDDELVTKIQDGEAKPQHLDTSDMWFNVEKDAGKIDFSYDVKSSGNESIIATTESGAIPTVKLTWTSTSTRTMPVLVGVLGLILTAIGFYMNRRQNHETNHVMAKLKDREAGARTKARRAARAAEETSVLPKVKDPVDVSREEQKELTLNTLGAGILPVSPRAEELRERPLQDKDRIVLENPESEEETSDAQEETNEPADSPTEPEVASTQDEDERGDSDEVTIGEHSVTDNVRGDSDEAATGEHSVTNNVRGDFDQVVTGEHRVTGDGAPEDTAKGKAKGLNWHPVRSETATKGGARAADTQPIRRESIMTPEIIAPNEPGSSPIIQASMNQSKVNVNTEETSNWDMWGEAGIAKKETEHDSEEEKNA
ncbi:hypothetical protein [Actinotignum urinale]|uniref:Uncharacterized protein n=1 Tax=Actinotignum urinale TaxID=190146 RepID=A0AAW9HNN4_9ACTO|nr:hypothetical protein [Actinotignum urinale]MDY5155266.1 hypothetical protein [Actinotignum urinale]